MTYPEAMAKLVGNPHWWFYDFHGSEREPDSEKRILVQAEAIGVAAGTMQPGQLVPRPAQPCASGTCTRRQPA